MEIGEYPQRKIEKRIIETYELNYFMILVLGLSVFLIIGGCYFLYLVNEGKFKPDISQPISTQVNSSTVNSYSFTPSTANTYNIYNNYTILNNNNITNVIKIYNGTIS